MDIQQFRGNDLKYLQKLNQSSVAVVLIHGYGASMYDLYDLHQIDARFDWFFPHGVNELYGEMSRSWFPIDEQALQMAMMQGKHRDLSGFEPPGIEASIEFISDFINDLPYDSVVLGGFSQGAMLSSHVAPFVKNKVKALCLFSGNLVDKNRLQKNSLELGLPVFQSHGKQDPILSFSGAMELKEFFESLKFSVEFVEFEGQHEIPPKVIQAWIAFMQRLNVLD